jgi:hypothetical protein
VWYQVLCWPRRMAPLTFAAPNNRRSYKVKR